MKVISRQSGGATIELSRHELVMLNNSMNETLNEIDEEEFETRVGATSDEVQALLVEVHKLIDPLPGAR
jgi:hypothetical protein